MMNKNDEQQLNEACGFGGPHMKYVRANLGKISLFTFRFKKVRYRMNLNKHDEYQIVYADDKESSILRVKSLTPQDLLESINLLMISKIHDA